jgi:hypothetical protein
MTESKILRFSATLIFAGFLFYFIVGLFHADQAKANDHIASFMNYADSKIWTAVHLGQFVGMAIIIVGILGLFSVSNNHSLANQLGKTLAIVTIALYSILQGVDGVALKQAVNAWANAPDAEKASRFASAEAIRWLEWGIRSYQSFLLGFTFILLAIVIIRTITIPKAIGYLIGLSGLAYIAQGWIIGSQGFSSINTIPTLSGYLVILVWSLWLLISTWRKNNKVNLN